jgi:PAS domain S-box-containing protein
MNDAPHVQPDPRFDTASLLAKAADSVLQQRRHALLVLDAERNILAANSAAEHSFGAAPGGLSGRSIAALIPPSHQAHYEAQLSGFIHSGETSAMVTGLHGPVVVQRLDGTEFSALSRLYSMEAGGERLVLIAVLDISSADSLRREFGPDVSAASVVVRGMPVGIVLQTAAGEIIEANESAQRILGLSHDQLVGRTSIDPRWRSVRADGSDFPGSEHPAMRAIQSGDVERDLMGIHKPDGTLTWIDVEARPIGISRESAVFVTFVDVSAMRATEAAMAAELRRSEVLASLSAEAVLVLDANLRITAVSGNTQRLIHRDVAHLLGQPFISLVEPADQAGLERSLGSLRNLNGARGQQDLQLRSLDGQLRSYECRSINLLRDHTVAGLVVNLRDIHDQRVAEARLRDANELLEQRLQLLSHERSIDAALARLAELLQHCEGVAEAREVLWASLPRLLPSFEVHLYFAGGDGIAFEIHRPQATTVGTAGADPDDMPLLLPQDCCWALRTQRTHLSTRATKIRCEHLPGTVPDAACVPVVVGGSVASLLVVAPRVLGQSLLPAEDFDRLATRLGIALGGVDLHQRR